MIDYAFAAGVGSNRKEAFRAAVDEYRKYTCINFVEKQLPLHGYHVRVVVQDENQCWVNGLGVGFRRLNLGWCNSMRHWGNMLHEIGHALGVMHEHQRPDATVRYHGQGPNLKMHWQNIPGEWRPQYVPGYTTYVGSANDGPGDPEVGYAPYDFSSIMHYVGSAANEFDTIPAAMEHLVGQRISLAVRDIQQFNDIYQCRVKTALKPGSVVALRGGRSNLYCADMGGGIKCDRGAVKEWEKFTVVDAGRGRIALKGGKDNGYCADVGNAVECNRKAIRQLESFAVASAGPGKIALTGGKATKYCADTGRGLACSKNAIEEDGKLTPEEQISVFYMKAFDRNTYVHVRGGTRVGNSLTMHSCPKHRDLGNCQWQLEPSSTRSGLYYIKASDQNTYIHASGGTSFGRPLTMHACPKDRDHPNCQWKLEPSTLRPGVYFIKASDRNTYIHVSGGTGVGNRLTMHTCQDKLLPNCQFHIPQVTLTKWTAISTREACELQPQSRRLFQGWYSTLGSCQKKCEEIPACMAVDYYTKSTWCHGFEEACTSPNHVDYKHGASSYKLGAT